MTDLQLRLELIEQGDWGLRFQIEVLNPNKNRILIPEPRLTGLCFEDVQSGQQLEWFGSLVSSSWFGLTIEPMSAEMLEFKVRPCRVPRPQDYWAANTKTEFEYNRWCIELRPGNYSTCFEYGVNEDYYDPDSHCRIDDVRGEASKLKASAWTGFVRSNELTIHQP